MDISITLNSYGVLAILAAVFAWRELFPRRPRTVEVPTGVYVAAE